MNVKSGGGTQQHHYTTKPITIPNVPNGKSRDRVGAGGESRMPEGKGNSSPEEINTRQCPLLKQRESPPMQTHPSVDWGTSGQCRGRNRQRKVSSDKMCDEMSKWIEHLVAHKESNVRKRWCWDLATLVYRQGTCARRWMPPAKAGRAFAGEAWEPPRPRSGNLR